MSNGVLPLYNQGEKFIFNQEFPQTKNTYQQMPSVSAELSKHIGQDLVYLTFKSAGLVKDGIKGHSCIDQIVPFP